MLVYAFESVEDGERIEREYSITCIPDSIEEDGRTYKRVFAGGGTTIMKRKDRAINDAEITEDRNLASKIFHAPNPNNPGGVSDHDLVKAGKATTVADSTWV